MRFQDPEDEELGPDPRDRRAGRRQAVYWVLVVVLLLGAILLYGSPWETGPNLHTVMEAMATVLALVVGGLALVRYYSKRRSTYLFIGTGFLGTAFLEAFHAVISSAPLAAGLTPGEFADLTSWSWVASRAFLSVFLFVSWLAWRRDEAAGGADLATERSVYTTAAALTLLVFLVFVTLPLAPAYHPDRFFSRPSELIPAFFFALALGAYLSKGLWRRDVFEHWLVVALIISVFQHSGYLVFSRELFDSADDAGHLLKLVSYVSVLMGLLMSVYVSFRREASASEEILEANQALAREVTVRAAAERTLQESQDRLRDFLDNAHDLIQSTDPDGTILYVNQAWKRTLGYEGEEVEGRNLFTLVDPECVDACREIFSRVFAGESVTGIEVIFRTRSGGKVICSGSSNARFENGRAVATRSIFRNVTDERRAAEELATSQANLRALFESTGDAIWSVDRNHRLITYNSAFSLGVEARVGREPGQGDGLEDLASGEEREWLQERYDRALAGYRFSEVRHYREGPDQRYFELFFNPILTLSGVWGVVVFSRDVTPRRRAEEALVQAKEAAEDGNRAKSQFMANMSHELRTPLNSVIGFANILLKDRAGKLGDQEKGYLDRILANGKHLLSLINEILDLSKIEAGRMELELEPVELGDLIRETLSQLEGQVRGKPVELRAKVPPDLLTIHADRGKLKQVVINLVGNALKFTETGNVTVQVETGADPRQPRRISVHDTGVGIPDDRLEAIFEAFQQADGSTTRKFGGTGLGLTISRSLCSLMDYDLTVESTVGEGSRFTIHLSPPESDPSRVALDEDEGAGRGQPPIPQLPGARLGRLEGLREKTIMVVDDEADSRFLLRHYLEEVGCRILTARDGVEAMELARSERPDLITLDLMMPRMSGWEFLQKLKADNDLSEIPVVVVSIVARDGTGEILGAADLLNKPVEREELLEVLQRSLLPAFGRVLVVEDDPDTQLLLERHLDGSGVEVRVTANGKEALQALDAFEPDVILLDLMMPVMDGFTFLKHLREGERHEGIPVVVLSARDLSPEEERSLDEQTLAFIRKGTDVEERLQEVLRTVLGEDGAKA